MAASYRLMLETERVVSGFPRRHKYDCGKELRGLAYEGHRLLQDAMRAKKDGTGRKADLLRQVIAANDSLKLRLPVAFDLQLFKSKGQFTDLTEIAAHVGRQLGALLRSMEHPKGQSSNA